MPTTDETTLTDARRSLPKWIEMIAATETFGNYGCMPVRKVKRHAKGVEETRKQKEHYVPHLDYTDYEPKPRPKRKQFREEKRLAAKGNSRG